MFTLKLFSPQAPPVGTPGEAPDLDEGDTLTWIADVTMCTVIARGPVDDFMNHAVAPRYNHLMNTYQPEVFFSSGATDLTLIIIEQGRFRNLLVDHAWLLGDNGKTIERIAP
jgi:hypothetical protein